MKSTKSFNTLETKESWYTWREKLLGPLEETLDDNILKLQRDERYIHQFSEDMDGMIADSKEHIQEMENKMSEIITKRNTDYKERKSTMDQLQEEEKNQEWVKLN